MAELPQMDIPDAMREMAERNVEQARNAYSQLLEMGRKSQEMLAKSSGAMTEATLGIQSKVLRFTEENIEASFKLAGDLARARDMKDYFEIQNRHAQRQMQVYAAQAQELAKLMAEASQKAQAKR